MATDSLLIWLTPALCALFLYGIGQGLVKKYISDVAPARFCLFFVFAKAIVNLWFFLSNDHPPPFSPESREFMWAGILAYTLDGIGWILYFKSIVWGPITIVGTLSAAYPATTVLFAWVFLGETLSSVQYFAVALVILGCVGLSYSPPGSENKVTKKAWILYASGALLIWGAAQTLVKYSYTLPHASEVNLALFNTFGGLLTLGVYGFLYGRIQVVQTFRDRTHEWLRSFLPMGMMAGGDLGVIIASRYGPISLVTPITGAYPMVTLAFAALVLKEKITALQYLCIILILVGMYFSPGSS